MDNLTNSVQIIKSHEALFSHDAHKRQRNAFIVVALYHFKQVDAKDFEDHDEMLAVGPMMQEAIQ